MSDEKETAPESAVNEELDTILKSGSVVAGESGNVIHTMTVIGQIEGHSALGDGQKAPTYEHLIPLIVSVEQSTEVDGLLLVLNTMGGDVEAGLALAELVAGMKKPTVSLVLGGGHSIGVPLAVCTKKSFIVPSATMTIHPVRMSGLVIGVPQTYYYFERMQDRIIKFITDHSSVSEETFREMLLRTDQIATDTGTLIDGRQAVECGLIDEVGSLSDALAELHRQIEETKKQ